jgi:hypothetical protein
VEKALKKEAKISAQTEIALADAVKLGYENPGSTGGDSTVEGNKLASPKEDNK